MSGSDFRITISTRAVFLCASGMVQFQILLNDKQVGKTFRYNLEEAAALDALIMKNRQLGRISRERNFNV